MKFDTYQKIINSFLVNLFKILQTSILKGNLGIHSQSYKHSHKHIRENPMMQISIRETGGGALDFFSGRGVQPGFPKCGACELTFASEKGGL